MTNTRRPLAAVALTSALLLAACGGDDGGSEDRARTVDPPSASAEADGEVEGAGGETLTQEQLQAALLTVQDLPTGYTAGTVTEDDDDTPAESDNPECSAKYEALDDADDKAKAKAEAAFEGSGLGTILEQSLASFEDEDTITKSFDEIASIFSECPTFSQTDAAGETTTFTIAPLSFPRLGDDTLAVSIKVETVDFGGTVNLAATRVGKNLQLVMQGGLTADAAALEQAARTGVDKLAAAG